MRRERFDKMNVVPFIDIVLVLLVIVLATASFVTHQSIQVDLPHASSKKKVDKKSTIIAIDKAGHYFLDETQLSLESLKEKLSQLDAKHDTITLRTDKASAFEYFVAVIEFLKARGFSHVAIVTKTN